VHNRGKGERRKADVGCQRFAHPSAALTFRRTDAVHVIFALVAGNHLASHKSALPNLALRVYPEAMPSDYAPQVSMLQADRRDIVSD